jgi:hypothetical protein
METAHDKVLRLFANTTLSYAKIAEAASLTKSQVQRIIEANTTYEQRTDRKPAQLWDKLAGPTPPLNIDSSANVIYYYRNTLLSLVEIAAKPDVYLSHYEVTLLINEVTTKQERLTRRREQMEMQAASSQFLEPYIPHFHEASKINRTNNNRDYHSVPTITTGGQDA